MREIGHLSGYINIVDAARSLTPNPSPGSGRGEHRAEMACQPFPESATMAGPHRRVGTDAARRLMRRNVMNWPEEMK
jgi:hypothetical protein